MSRMCACVHANMCTHAVMRARVEAMPWHMLAGMQAGMHVCTACVYCRGVGARNFSMHALHADLQDQMYFI